MASEATDRDSVPPQAGDPATAPPPLRDHPRYRVGSPQPEGHFLGHDVEAGRDVAVRPVVAPEGATPIEIARAQARSEHPALPAVHDVIVGRDGSVCLVERLPRGIALADAIASAAHGRPHRLLAKVVGCVQVLCAAAEGLAFAHARGRVHGDIRPEHLLVGDHGEVTIVGWDHPARPESPFDDTGDFSASLHHSPERLAGAGPSAADDVYALASTAFTLLTGRPPIRARQGTQSWQRRARGEVDAPDANERARAPAAVLQAVLAALAPEPARRPANAREFAERLRAALQPVPVAERPARARRRRIVAAAAVLIALATAAFLLWRSPAADGWQQPILVEDFRDDGWRDRWLVTRGEFIRRDGALVTGEGKAHFLVLRQRLQGPVAIEFDGEMLPGAQPGDLSVISIGRLDPTQRDGFSYDDAIALQTGAYDNTFAGITQRRMLAYAPLRLESGRRYRIRAEIDSTVWRLLIDGRLVCEHRSVFPRAGGHLALYGYYSGKSFANIRIQRRRMPPQVPATSVGDSYLVDGDHVRAREHYQRVIDSVPRDPIVLEARYKLGLAWMAEGVGDRAVAVWQPLLGTALEPDVRLRRVEIEIGRSDDEAVLRNLAALWDREPRLRPEIADLWSRTMHRREADFELEGADRWLRFWEERLTQYSPTRSTAAAVMSALGREEECFTRFTDNRRTQARALIGLCRHDELLRDFPDQRQFCAQALYERGDFARVIAEYPDVRWVAALSHVALGLTTDWEAAFADERSIFLYATGRWEEMAELPANVGNEGMVQALFALDRHDEAIAAAGTNGRLIAQILLATRGGEADVSRWSGAAEVQAQVSVWQALDACVAGDLPLARERLAGLQRLPRRFGAFGRWLMAALVARLAGDEEGARRLLEQAVTDAAELNGRRYAYDAGFILGRIDEAAFRAQPRQAAIEARLHLARAMKADFAGDGAAALASYRAWLQVPLRQREAGRDRVVERFVAWRTGALAAP